MAIFNSYVKLPEGTSCLDLIDAQLDHLRAAMPGMAADALGQQLFDLLTHRDFS